LDLRALAPGAVDALRGVGQSLQTLLADQLTASHAFAVSPGVDPFEGGMDLLCLHPRRTLDAFEDLIGFGFGRLFFEIGTRRGSQIPFNLVDPLVQVPKAGFELLPYLGDINHTSSFPSYYRKHKELAEETGPNRATATALALRRALGPPEYL
jgi:hypothetical protein